MKTFKQYLNETINTAQDKAQRKVFNGLEKKIIKPKLDKPDFQKKLIKPMQSNIKNMIDSLASHPTGVATGITTGAHV